MAGDMIEERLRTLCLALPEAHEKLAWGCPTFRVSNRMFAIYVHNHHGDGRIAVWCKAAPGVQDVMVEVDPERCFVPPYMGPKGWIGLRLDRDLDWSDLTEVLREAWCLVAPRRLVARLDADSPTSPASLGGSTRRRGAGDESAV